MSIAGVEGGGRVDPRLMARLGEEDRREIRRAQAEAPPPPPPPVSDHADRIRPAAPSPRSAGTPREAVQAIHAQPLPRSDDLAGLSWSVQQAMYQPRVEAFNEHRSEEARAALERLAPRREDFAGLNAATANAEYRDALVQFNADPYVRELRRIDAEATAAPGSLPAYLTRPEPTVDTRGISVGQMRDTLAALGVQIPAQATPEQIDAGFELLATMPQALAATLINRDLQVSYTQPLAGVGTTPFLPVGGSAGLALEGEARLTDGQVGTDLETTHQLDLSVELRGSVQGGTQVSLQRQIYNWARHVDTVMGGSLGVQSLVESSPVLRNAVRGLPFSLSYEAYRGARLSYTAVVTPDQAERIGGGDLAAAPNPLSPLDMPPGSSVLIRGQSLTGHQLDAGYKLLQVGTGHTELDGLGFGVRRTVGSTVEIIAGPVSTVENELNLGLKYVPVDIRVEASAEVQELRVARLDLATEEGRAAYDAFIASGQVPHWNPPGVQRAGTQTVFDYEHAKYLGVGVGPLAVSWGGPDGSANITATRWEDGSADETWTSTLFGVTSEVSFTRDAAGRPLDDTTTWRLVVPDVHESLATVADAAYHPGGAQRSFDGNQHVRYTFDADDLMALRDQARRAVVANWGEETLAALEAGTMGSSHREFDLALADTPDEVFLALQAAPNFLQQDLYGLSMFTGEAVPGEVSFRDAGG